MAAIAHLSDIHFGANDPKIVAATEAWLQARQPDLVIISGDFTQRARVSQFRQAAAYVNRLRAAGHNLLVVPGNHDVPLYDVVRRFAAPLQRYKRFISNDLCPWFENDEISVLGINTARSLTIKDGRINREQIALLKRRFAAVIIIQAGTATSTRLRHAEPQSFNWLEVASHDRFSLQVIAWGGTSFLEGSKVAFTYDGEEWQSRKEL